MAIDLLVPSVGESITEVEIGAWSKAVGDSVTAGEKLVEIETDKVTVELPAPATGVLKEIVLASGSKSTVGALLGRMESAAAGAAAKPTRNSPAAPPQPATPQPPSSPEKPAPAAKPAAPIMPAARRALAERGLDAAQVTPTGPGGRMLKEDVERTAKAPAPAAPAAPGPAVDAAGREEDVVPMSSLRRKLAARLVEAQHTAAILSTFNEIDMSAVKDLRAEYQEAFQTRHGVKLGFLSFFVKAAIDALKQFPAINAEIRGTDIVYRNYFDIGVAVGGGKGLVVPVLRSAERMSFAEIEKAVADFGARAKANTLKLEELAGGTFTISNGGVYGSLLSTPILNPPQSGILGLHAIQDRPIARNGQVVIRPMMYVALSYDHRLVDGREAVTFLRRIKDAVENPARLLLEV